MGKNEDTSGTVASTRSRNQDRTRSSTGQEEYLMFVDHDDDDDAPPLALDHLPPPTYQDSITITQDGKTSSSSSSNSQPLPIFHFFKSSSLKSREARIQSTDGKRAYRLTADIHQSTASTISLYSISQGGDTDTCLGSVSFTPGSNNFQVLTSGRKGNSAPAGLIQVRAKIGVPHAQSYTFTLPPPAAVAGRGKGRGREVMWDKMSSGSSAMGYQLKDTTWQTSLATWELVEKEKFDAVLRWQEHPRNEWEEIVVLLSFIGSMTRLRLKGKDMSGIPTSGRWGVFWGMAMLGTAGMADF